MSNPEQERKTAEMTSPVRQWIDHREIVQRVRRYAEHLLRNDRVAPSPAVAPELVETGTDETTDSRLLPIPEDGSGGNPGSRPQSLAGPLPNRTILAGWLVEQRLLSQSEADYLLRSSNPPRDFGERVLGRFAEAEAISDVPGITSELIIPAIPEQRFELPTRTFDGPHPPLLRSGRVRYLPVELHIASTGKVFLGQKLSTLMLDRKTFHTALSRPASKWITPVFAEAPGELRLSGTVAILYANGATHFSHWMFDLLPKVEVLRRAGWTDNRIDHYVVNAFRTGFQKEAFDRLGIPHEKVVAGSSVAISADRLLIPSDIRLNFRTPRWVGEFTRSLFPQASGEARRRENRRLYISRARARRRRILNQEELDPILHRFGFRTVFAEDLTIAQCAALVRDAEDIFAPHGAGATNVVFGAPGLRLLESYSAHIAPEGWLLAHSLGGRHYLLAGHDQEGRFPWEPGAYEGFSERDRNYADYVVRPANLERALEILTAR